MKYYELKEIVNYLSRSFNKINYIKRIYNNVLYIEFKNNDSLYIDVSKSNSLIYKTKNSLSFNKDFTAPFDIVLKKRFSNSIIEEIKLYNDDKIINIKTSSSLSYKKQFTTLQVELTGKYTNVIILDENRVILEALRHIDEFSSSRIVKVGYKLQELPKKDYEPISKPIQNIEQYLYEIYYKKEKESLKSLKIQKISLIDKKIRKLNLAINSLPNKIDLERESLDLYKKANIILSNMHKIKPYQNHLKIIENNEEFTLILNPNQSAAKNSDSLFKKAKKAKQKALNISLENNVLNEKLNYLNRLKISICNSNSIDECEFLFPKKNKNKAFIHSFKHCETFYFEGFKILVGTNERENIYILENSKASDFWFHLKNMPSCHVIVQNSKKILPDSVIQKAADLCVKFSVDYKGTYQVDYTQRRNVKIQNKANVLYNPYETIIIKY